ncbi:hypothetical protein [Brachybacterium sp. FME24]|uniref:hypothetical protein n=1 Tax=Brachybacterium sp. FME24 TaxID=2742605 RepID=UPI0018674753|nr:hypothetical protein [Brachybacterium sp. FME24]
MNRRGLLGGVAALATVALSSCGNGLNDLAENAAEAANGVDGIASAQLELSRGANFERLLHGTLSLDAADRGAGLTVYDEAMRQIVTVIHDEVDAETATGLRVGGVAAALAGGDEMTPLDLDPDMPTSDPRLDRVTAGAFYGKYGLS